MTAMTAEASVSVDIIETAREQVLERGGALRYEQITQVLRTPDGRLEELLALAHEVRMRYNGPEVEVEGIVSIKTGGCPEDCHFCSQSGQFTSPVRSVWLDIPELVRAARQTRESGASEFCIVAAVRGPDERLMRQMREGVAAIRAEVDIQVAASLGMLTQAQVDDLVDMGVHRYNHNLEAGRSYFPQVVTTHSFDERWETCLMVKASGMELCCGGLVGMGESLEQRAELAAQLGELAPHEVPLNFLNPRPGTPFGDLPVMGTGEALRTIAAFRLALPCTILRYAGGRELTLGDLGTRDGLLGGINAVIVGNYLTTLGRDPHEDLALLADLGMPHARIVVQHGTGAPATSGIDVVSILFTANKGAQPQTLSKAASGGEFSRLMLCIKYMLADKTALPTIVFDEIDTGISGEIAVKVGRMMQQMAQKHQLVAISHLPQMAAAGDVHYFVYKEDRADRTVSRIRELSAEDRIKEIAHMIAGAKPSENAFQSARELLALRGETVNGRMSE